MRKSLLAVMGVAAVLICLGLAWSRLHRGGVGENESPLPAIKASTDPIIIDQGRYLFHAVAHCTACHLPHDAVAFATPEKTWQLLPAGGREWNMGEIGVIRSANITPDRVAGIGEWTDREVARALKHAVNRDGHAIFFMNGMGYIDDRDVRAIVSYLQTLGSIAVKVPRTQITAQGAEILRTKMQGWLQPRPQIPVPYVAGGEVSVGRGAYLANGPARCVHCHSNLLDSPRMAIDGPAFAGSLWPQPDPDDPKLEINAPNLTPSESYGSIARWSEDVFVARFRAGRVIKNSDMPWENFRLMSDADLISIFRYLKSLPPADRNAGPTYRLAGWKAEPTAVECRGSNECAAQ